ncbi:MAG TPA: M42 family metallopeptidase [Clostridiaceae bacterium]|nr:M42 family metallopeptidase [Clostridiaceae bacterium]
MGCLDTLKELTQYTAVSGREYEFAAVLKDKFSEICDSVEIDKFYNVIALKKGMGINGPRIMVLAHLDEIGFLVKSIDKNGFIKFTNVGGIDARILLSHEVIIHGKKDITGVIGAKPPHMLEADEKKKAVKIDELYIDTGMDAKELKKYVSIGDAITLKSHPFFLKDNKYSSKSVDNRCGVTVLIETANELKKLKHKPDVYFVATVQEELNLAGARITSFNIEPDIAIVVDACHGDVPGAPKEVVFPLGKGPAIGIGPILNRELTERMLDTAKENNIPHQVDVEPGSTGTDAWATQVSKYGIPTVLVSIPVRYMHTSIETVHANDIKYAGKLISRFIAERV